MVKPPEINIRKRIRPPRISNIGTKALMMPAMVVRLELSPILALRVSDISENLPITPPGTMDWLGTQELSTQLQDLYLPHIFNGSPIQLD